MTTDQPTLLPCPFCGDTPKGVDLQRKYDFDFAVECNCGACMSQCQYAGGPGQESRDKTIEQWNTRAPSTELSDLRAEVERVRCERNNIAAKTRAEWTGKVKKAIVERNVALARAIELMEQRDNAITVGMHRIEDMRAARDEALARVRELEGSVMKGEP